MILNCSTLYHMYVPGSQTMQSPCLCRTIGKWEAFLATKDDLMIQRVDFFTMIYCLLFTHLTPKLAIIWIYLGMVQNPQIPFLFFARQYRDWQWTQPQKINSKSITILTTKPLNLWIPIISSISQWMPKYDLGPWDFVIEYVGWLTARQKLLKKLCDIIYHSIINCTP